MSIWHEALRLEGGDHRRIDPVGQLQHRLAEWPGTVSDDDHRPLSHGQHGDGTFQLSLGWTDLGLRHTSHAGAVDWLPDALHFLHLIREDEVCDIPVHDRMLDRER